MSSVIVSGFYGKGNLGDEAILAGLKEIFFDVDLKPLTFDVSYTHALHDLHGIERNDLPAVIRGIRDGSKVISGGGGLFQDWSPWTPFYYASIYFLSCILGRRIYAVGQSLGPLKRKSSEWITLLALRLSTAIFVRDTASREFLVTKLKKEVHLSGDLAFQLEKRYSSEKKRNGSYRVGLNLRNWKFTDRDYAGIVCSSLNRIRKDHDASMEVTVSPFRGEDERDLTDRLLSNLCFADSFLTRNPHCMIEKIAGMDLFISMRLHGIIFSLLTATPFIALSYDEKTSNFLNTFGLSEFEIKLEELTEDRLIKKYLLIRDNYNKIREKLILVKQRIREISVTDQVKIREKLG